MLLLVFVALAIASVPVAGGRFHRLIGLRFHSGWLVPLAFLVQTTGLFLPGISSGMRSVAQAGAYAFAGTVIAVNLRMPGLWLVGCGALSNFIAVLANGGVMPATPGALARAGRVSDPAHFTNSAAVTHPHLPFLGDVFALPTPLPFHNVFSIGDVCLAVGALVVLHRGAGSRLVPPGDGQFVAVMRQPAFVRLWSAQVVSNFGDWSYTLAVATIVVQRTHDARMLALLLAAQVGPAAVAGALFGPLVDRIRRNRLMVFADVARAIAVASLLLAPSPSMLQLCAVGACLGVFGSLFQPSLQASIPNIVAPAEIVAANATVSATYHLAVMAGPALGGLLVVHIGGRAVFALNMLSFCISAVLVAGLRLPKPTRAPGPPATPMQDLRDGLRYVLATPMVRGILVVVGLVVLAAAIKAPLESLFVLHSLNLGPGALGLVTGAWGAGMLLGSAATPAVVRRWSRERVFAVSIAGVGLAVLSISQAATLGAVLGAWLIGGLGNAMANVCYESLLQERTPDALRGRVFAATETVLQASLLAGVLVAGWFGSRYGVRLAYGLAGILLVLAALLARVLVPGTDRRPRDLSPGGHVRYMKHTT